MNDFKVSQFAQPQAKRSVAGTVMWVFLVSAPSLYGAAGDSPISFPAASTTIVTPAMMSGPERRAVEVLAEEIERRTEVRCPVRNAWPKGNGPVIAVGPVDALDAFAGTQANKLAADLGDRGAEGYHLRSYAERDAVFVVGNDARGVLFGVGRLLRAATMTRGKIAWDAPLRISAVPEYPLRGHQLGFRPKTNSYDAWSVEIWDQYIRDLAVFGNNAVELIPPRSDDDDDSPHFPLPKIEMMAQMSRICAAYGLDVWIWYPAMDKDYSDPKTVAFALAEWEEVYKKLPRIDVIFVPGGDPGHTQPKHLMAMLEKQTEVLHRHHPDAQMWMSPQSFTGDWMAEFETYMQTVKPAWLGGIVFGPQNRISLPDLRKTIPASYPIRRYPDITHSIRCQYAVPDWDVAYAMTEEREVINPRPIAETQIFRLWDRESIGFITYSEGCNDDVNKIIWSGLGWDRNADPVDTLREYARYFIGPDFTDDFTQGLLALERNWRGPLLINEGVNTTLQQFVAMEKKASPQVRLNWRFQQALYRAYYDGYNRRRLIYETQLEQQANDELRLAGSLGAILAVDRAEAILQRAVTDPVAADLRARVFEMAEALYQSIRMQTSVPRYQAIHWGRGGNLDLIDRPLNNRRWLSDRFTEIRSLTDEDERLAKIDGILNWTNPGPGGFYDDLGDPANQPHLITGPGAATDPEFRTSARVGFAYQDGRRISWIRHAESRYDAPLRMRYTDLDPNAQYRLRVVYAGDRFRTRLRLVADEKHEVHGFRNKPYPLRPVEFAVPHAATDDGELTLQWRQDPGQGGAGRGCQIAEVWLMTDE